jgi:hypothetical protein
MSRALDELSRRCYLATPADRVFVSPAGGPLVDRRP